ncbi:MAG: hypothetical protein M1824_005340 [Vezdaea acicularis]|nr:MAG: hypothetical protein M1824_005340 [Vezdaea acicularis]
MPTQQVFKASDYINSGKKHILLAASGSVATIKILNIVRKLGEYRNTSIRLLLTEPARRFLGGQSPEQVTLEELGRMTNVDGVHLDEDEWKLPWRRGDPILHIELRRWADILVVAPLSANSMAKMVGGFSDNLLLSVIRAWDTTGEIEGREKPKKIVVAPAMNTGMWRHPVTKKHIKLLEEDWGGDDGWVEVLRPIEKTLACGDVGDGAMKEWTQIVEVIVAKLPIYLQEDHEGA